MPTTRMRWRLNDFIAASHKPPKYSDWGGERNKEQFDLPVDQKNLFFREERKMRYARPLQRLQGLCGTQPDDFAIPIKNPSSFPNLKRYSRFQPGRIIRQHFRLASI